MPTKPPSRSLQRSPRYDIEDSERGTWRLHEDDKGCQGETASEPLSLSDINKRSNEFLPGLGGILRLPGGLVRREDRSQGQQSGGQRQQGTTRHEDSSRKIGHIRDQERSPAARNRSSAQVTASAGKGISGGLV